MANARPALLHRKTTSQRGEGKRKETRCGSWAVNGGFFSMICMLQRCSVMFTKFGGQIMKIPRGKFTFKDFVYQGL